MGQKIQIRSAAATEAKPLIGIYAESGRGKTLSALIAARGFVGPNGKILMIETESGRGEAYQGHPDVGNYEVISLRGSFSPAEFVEALDVAEASKPGALIIDSASHEWEGAGGVLDMAAQNQAAGKKGPIVWQQPKMQHQRFVLRLLQTPIDLVIVCMRAKYPMEQKGKDWQRSGTLSPKQSEDILFELFIHGWIDDQHRFHGTKYTTEVWKDALRDGDVITTATGQRLRAIAAGDRAMAAPDDNDHASLLAVARMEALGGSDAMKSWWGKQSKADRAALKDDLIDLRQIAADADTTDEGASLPESVEEAGGASDTPQEDDAPPAASAIITLKIPKGSPMSFDNPSGWLNALRYHLDTAKMARDIWNENFEQLQEMVASGDEATKKAATSTFEQYSAKFRR